MNVRQAAARYVALQRVRGRFTKSTAETVGSTLSRFATATGNPAVGNLKPRHVDRWFVRQTNLAASTRRRNFSQIRSFCDFAVRERWLKINPCAAFDAPRAPRSQPRSLASDDVHRVLVAARDERVELMVLLAVQEGLRRCEIARLERGDINLGDRLMRVVGKGGHERFVPISDQTIAAIERYGGAHGTGPLIRSMHDRGRPITPDQVGRLITEAFKLSGVKRAVGDGRSAHALRHTAANDVLEASRGDVRLVQEFLGHQSLQTTTIYVKRFQAIGKLRTAAAGRHY